MVITNLFPVGVLQIWDVLDNWIRNKRLTTADLEMIIRTATQQRAHSPPFPGRGCGDFLQ